jgi:flavin reductase (DIM6/NTAB) family NADH-FMN oxidoreductase RutF
MSKILPALFEGLSRQQFRRFFQPSRVVLAIMPAPTSSGVNITTLCFSMYCAYKPPMIAVAFHDRSASYQLMQDTDEYVLAVPGNRLAEAAMFCGTTSMREVDKVTAIGLELCESQFVDVPGLKRAIANVEMRSVTQIKTGDHLLVVGEVLRFGVNKRSTELPLVSFGPDERGYRLIAKKGIHRLGTVNTDGVDDAGE